MRQQISTLIAALSLILMLVSVLFCVRSHFTSDSVHITGGKAYRQALDPVYGFGLTTSGGGISLAWYNFNPAESCDDFRFDYQSEPRRLVIGEDRSVLEILGFRWSSESHKLGAWWGSIGVPLPLIVGLLAIFPIRCWRARKRLNEGSCRACGYDLRATPERCPECGALATGTRTGLAVICRP